jgi:hypothetical protein
MAAGDRRVEAAVPGAVGVLTVVGMVLVVPLGLLRLGTPGVRRLVAAWPFLGLVAAAGLLRPRGAVAVALVLPYAAACLAVTALAASRGLRWLARRDTPLVREMTAAMAGASLGIAAQALVAERAGWTFLGFDLGTLGLTVAHFHFAGFAAVLLAGLTAAAAPGRLAEVGAWCVPAGIALTFAGFFTTNDVELAGAAVLATGLLATSAVVLRRVAPRQRDRSARALLSVSAAAAPLTMTLALWWAAGESLGFAHPTLRQMAATHGLANALGVAVCGLLAWRRLAPPPV